MLESGFKDMRSLMKNAIATTARIISDAMTSVSKALR
jgi:hypothetical protein